LTGNTESTAINYERFFQQLLEVSLRPVIIVNRSLAICFYNQRAVQLLQATEPLQGVRLDTLLHEEPIVQLVRESIRSGQVCQTEYNKDNGNIVWHVSVSPLEHDGEQQGKDYTYFAVAIENLTELRRMELVRRDFIANISHELRTPLASVRLLAETLEDVIDTNHEQAQVFVEKIETEVQYLTDLVTELLELSRIESGLVPMVIEPVEAEQLVREAMARMLPLAQRHRVTLQTEIQQGTTRIAADSKQIVRVLVNLIHNAIKFTPSGGKVVIGTWLDESGQTQQFFVRDTGVGIRPEELSRVFERFYKADRARAKTTFIGPGGGGSGLGLAIARHVVEAHGGRITAESAIGQGSTFTFRLPVVA
jgi:two-component system phosphate regulon sensor histidine kinase PhoR